MLVHGHVQVRQFRTRPRRRLAARLGDPCMAGPTLNWTGETAQLGLCSCSMEPVDHRPQRRSTLRGDRLIFGMQAARGAVWFRMERVLMMETGLRSDHGSCFS